MNWTFQFQTLNDLFKEIKDRPQQDLEWQQTIGKFRIGQSFFAPCCFLVLSQKEIDLPFHGVLSLKLPNC